MSRKIIQRNHVHPVFRIVLLILLVICGMLLIAAIAWIFYRVYYSIGLEIAEVTITIISILILILILIGLRAGLGLDRFIRDQNAADWSVYQSSGQIRDLIKLLGYEELQPESEETAGTVLSNSMEMAMSLSNTSPRRGRPPTYSLERWTRVVLAWENRDSLRNPMTLAEFLCKQFGENADGSPRISENCFYANRKKVLDEFRQTMEAKKNLRP